MKRKMKIDATVSNICCYLFKSYTCTVWVGRQMTIETISAMSDKQIYSSFRHFILPTVSVLSQYNTHPWQHERAASEQIEEESVPRLDRTDFFSTNCDSQYRTTTGKHQYPDICHLASNLSFIYSFVHLRLSEYCLEDQTLKTPPSTSH